MKIGILTLPLHNNYGGIIQAYALQTILKRMGHDAVVIDKSREIKLPIYKRYFQYFKLLVRKVLLDRNTIILWDQKYNREYKTISTYTLPFIQQYIKRFIAARDYSNIKQGDFDAFVVGSDQVWRPRYFGQNILSNAFLSFAKDWDVKRISYAASFGTEEWEYTEEQTSECKDWIKKFDAVSVRESSAVKLCKEHLGVDALHVLDPTMLLSATDYIQLFKEANTPQSPGSLMCYVLDKTEDKQKVVSNVEETLNLTAFSVNSKYEVRTAPLKERIQPPVEAWLRGFYDAEFVVTDSFHACVFSILFEKPFVVYGNKDRGMARFHSLLSIFGLETRLVTGSAEAQNVISVPIDWSLVNTKKKEWQEKSYNFLKNNL